MNSKAFSIRSPKARDDETAAHKSGGISDLSITETLVSPHGEHLILNVSNIVVCLVSVSTFHLYSIHLKMLEAAPPLHAMSYSLINNTKIALVAHVQYVFRDMLVYTDQKQRIGFLKIVEEEQFDIMRSSLLVLKRLPDEDGKRELPRTLKVAIANGFDKSHDLETVLGSACQQSGKRYFEKIHNRDTIQRSLDQKRSLNPTTIRKIELNHGELADPKTLAEHFALRDASGKPKHVFALTLDSLGTVSVIGLDCQLCYSLLFGKSQMSRLTQSKRTRLSPVSKDSTYDMEAASTLGNLLTPEKIFVKIAANSKADFESLVIRDVPRLHFSLGLKEVEVMTVTEVAGKKLLAFMQVNLTLLLLDFDKLEAVFLESGCYLQSKK